MFDGRSVTILNSELEYKLTLRNSMVSLFQSIQREVDGVIDFLGYTKDEYVLNPYPLTIERKDGNPISEVLLECIKSRLGNSVANKSASGQ